MSIFKKAIDAAEVALDSYIQKAQVSNTSVETPAWDRLAALSPDYVETQQHSWIEKRSSVTNDVLKNIARKDSVIVAILLTKLAQIAPFAQPQKDRYSPGWRILPRKSVDISREDKLALTNPDLSTEDYDNLRFELDKKLAQMLEVQEQEIQQVMNFLTYCGVDPLNEDDFTRSDFDTFLKIIVMDRLIYNYSAVEKIPSKDMSKIVRFYPVSAGTIRRVSKKSSDLVKQQIAQRMKQEGREDYQIPKEDFCYVQIVRGKIVAAWTAGQLVFEPGIPSVDPEDIGYAPGELTMIIKMVTAHLYAEAHNQNFFTQGIGTKGILHIKGENVSRAQLEGFSRMWQNKVVNSRNAFRPPIVGIAEDVKWVPLADSNKDMEFDNWMHYLIRIISAVMQIDPAEINFDVSKVSSSTLNETNSTQKLKQSRDKGLKPLLDYVENIINRHLIRHWDEELASKYEFKFVGIDAETRKQEIERLEQETKVYKTINEARNEMGFPPIDDGDMIRDATYTQFRQMKLAQDAAEVEEAELEESDEEILEDLDSAGENNNEE